jgi:hypothetical protein
MFDLQKQLQKQLNRAEGIAEQKPRVTRPTPEGICHNFTDSCVWLSSHMTASEHCRTIALELQRRLLIRLLSKESVPDKDCLL